MEETKKCPYCGEEIMAVAKKCRYCGEWLDDKPSPTIKVEKINKTLLSSTIGCIVLVIAVVVIILTTSGHDNKGSDMYSDIISQDSIAYVSQIDRIKMEITRDSMAVYNGDYDSDVYTRYFYNDQDVRYSKFVISQIPIIRKLTGIEHGTVASKDQIKKYQDLTEILDRATQSRMYFALTVIENMSMQEIESHALQYRDFLWQWEDYKNSLDTTGKYHKQKNIEDVKQDVCKDMESNFWGVIWSILECDSYFCLINKIQND